MVYTFIQAHLALYWAIMTVLLCADLAGWYYLGSTQVAPVQPRRGTVRWSWNPAHRLFLWQIGAIAIAGRFDTSQRELAASVIVKVR